MPVRPIPPHSESTPLILAEDRQSLRRTSSLQRIEANHYLSDIVDNSPRHGRSLECFYIINDWAYHLKHGDIEGVRRMLRLPLGHSAPVDALLEQGGRVEVDNDDDHRYDPVDRRRKVVGILVLQFGIMIHSLVIGLTLAITQGSEYSMYLHLNFSLFVY